MNKINILGITNGNNSGVSFFRMQTPLNYLLSNYNDNFNIICLSDNNVNLEAPELDTINICHFHANCCKNKILMDKLIKMQSNGCKLIMDLDDFFEIPTTNPYHKYYNENLSSPIKYYLKKVDYITTSTKLFKAELKKWSDKKVTVFPNVIDNKFKQFEFKGFNYGKITEHNKLRIGLLCGSSHRYDIELLRGLVKGLGDYNKYIQWSVNGFDISGNKHPELSVWNIYEQIMTDDYKLISDDYKAYLLRYDNSEIYPDIENQPYRRYWAKDIHSYGELYNNIDVLLAPLENNKFNHMKSELKIVECGNFGKIFIGSNIGIYKEVITNGCDGLLINNRISDWIKAIIGIINNELLRESLQINCYNLIKTRYSIDKWTKKRCEFYKSII